MAYNTVVSDNGDTLTILTPNREGGPGFEWTFKKIFLKVFDLIDHLDKTKDSKDPAVVVSCYEHMFQHKFDNYLHNEHGHAVMSILAPEFKQWYINGKELTEEEVKKLQHNAQFKEKFDDFLTNYQKEEKAS